MTNGEKLQEIFPNADIDWGSHPNSNVLAHFDTKETNPKTCAWFTHRWWNEEYKEPKIGHWIDAGGDNAICGCCNRLNHLYGTYCKHCGAKMVEPQESEDKK